MELNVKLKKIQEILKQLKWTQKRLAQETKISERTVSRWFTENINPKPINLMKIAKSTGYSSQWLLSDNDSGPKLESQRWAWRLRDLQWGLRELNAFYERVQEIMDAMHISKEQLIRMANPDLTGQDCRNWHFLGSKPTAITIEKVAIATGYNKDWLLTGRGLRTPTSPSSNNRTSAAGLGTQILTGDSSIMAGGNINGSINGNQYVNKAETPSSKKNMEVDDDEAELLHLLREVGGKMTLRKFINELHKIKKIIDEQI